MMVCVLYTGQYTDCGSYRTSEASDFSILVSILVVDHIGTSEASDFSILVSILIVDHIGLQKHQISLYWSVYWLWII